MATVTSVSSSQSGSFRAGAALSIEVKFDGIVDVNALGGTPTLTLETGSTDRLAAYTGGGGTDTLFFSYTVQAGDTSADLDIISANALTLNGATISDASTLDPATLVLPEPGQSGSLGATSAVVIDTTAPTVAITSSAPALIAGQTATITFTFSEDPQSTFTWNGSSGDVVVSGGTLSALSGSGLTRTATFTPIADTNDGTASITVAAGSYADAAGNIGGAGSHTFGFDTKVPTASSAPDLAAASDSGSSSTDDVTNITSPTFVGQAGSAEAGATLRLYDTDGTTLLGSTTVNGDGSWQVTSTTLSQGLHSITAKVKDTAGNVGPASDALNITIDTTAPAAPSTPDLEAASDSGSFSTDNTTSIVTPTFSGTAQAGASVVLYDSDGTTIIGSTTANGSGNWSIVSSTLSEGAHTVTAKATDIAGNVSAASSGLTTFIDTASPSVSSVAVPPNGTYSAGQTLNFTVNFGETVTVDSTNGTPLLSLILDTGGTVQASYLSGSGSTSLTFQYTVSVGDADANGITIGSLSLNGSTILDAAGNSAALTLNGVGSTAGVLVDTSVPTITGLTASPDGTYAAGASVDVTVAFSEAVTVATAGGTPRLALETGATDRFAEYVSGSGTSSIVFRYVVQAGNTAADLDAISTTALTLNGGTIRDSSGNNASLTLPTPGASGSLGANANIVVEAVAPVFTSAAVNGSTLKLTYGESLDATNIPAANAFAVLVGGQAATVSNVAVTGSTVTLTLAQAVTNGQTVTVGYADPSNGNDVNAIQDAAGNDAITITNQAVTNNTVATPQPPTSQPPLTEGTSGNDNIAIGASTTPVFGGAGSDQITATPAAGTTAQVYGGSGFLDPNDAGDMISVSGGGSGIVYGNGGDDQIVVTSTGAASVFGGVGNDQVTIRNDAANQVTAGPGADVIQITGNGDNQVLGGSQINDPNDGADRITITGNGNNLVYANGGDDVIVFTGSGSNTVFAGVGNDTIVGGSGADRIVAGPGSNVITGGAGADRFVHTAGGQDIITDFNFAQGDRIELGGQAYAFTQTSDGNAAILIGQGGVIVLQGVAPGSLTADYFA